MLILALDTSADRCGALLCRDGRVIAESEAAMSRGHAEALPTMVAELFASTPVAAADVSIVVATTGPGTFTGVRVGVAFARGLALATGCPVMGVSSLECMVGSVERGPVVAALETRRGEIQMQGFDAERRPSGPPVLVDRATAESQLIGAVGLVGRFGDLGETRADLVRLPTEPSARGALDAALRKLDRGERPVPGVLLEPIYLRPADADPAAGRALVG